MIHTINPYEVKLGISMERIIGHFYIFHYGTTNKEGLLNTWPCGYVTLPSL